MKESEVEKHLVEQVELRGGFAPKWTDPGRRGAPDRIVMLPEYATLFVELKRPRCGKVAELQKEYHRLMSRAGKPVYILRSIADVDAFLACLR